jgi:L-iditol 2-dehydrogenase
MSGVVAEVGEGTRGFAAGDRVVAFPLLWCGSCAACELGVYARCTDYDYLGSRRDGGFGEYVVAPVRNLLRLPPEVPLDLAALAEPAAVALHALRRCDRTVVGQTVVVFGAGPIGILVAQWAGLMGAARVIMFDPVDARRELALRCGADLALDPRQDPARERVGALTAGNGAPVCIEAAGVPSALTAACECVAPGGVVVLLGNPSSDATLPRALLSRLLRTEATLVGVWNSTYSHMAPGDDWTTAVGAMGARALDPGALITGRVALDDACEVLDSLRSGRSPHMKVLIGSEP